MNDDTTRAIREKEWEQRYESYRSFRGQYITSISVIFTIWIVGLAFTFGRDMSDADKPIMLGFLTVLLASYTIVQFYVRQGLRRLGDRIQKLEGLLGIEKYRTTLSLERIILCSGSTILVATILTAYLTVRSLR